MTGKRKPGERLIERSIARQFDVSPIPVREALRELESRGLVTSRLNAGCTVVQLAPEDVRSVCEVRDILEPQVVLWAAQRMTPATARRLRKLSSAMSHAASRQDLPGYFLSDIALHRAIWVASGNRFAARALESFIGALFAMGLMRLQPAGRIDLLDGARRHVSMVEALAAGDGPSAAGILLAISRIFSGALQDL